MTKLLVVLLVVAVALWALLGRKRGAGRERGSGARPDAPSAAPPPVSAPSPAGSAQDMVRCAHCGLHLPAPDAVQSGGHLYCGAEHAAAGPRGP
jgi:uncharacterized protein